MTERFNLDSVFCTLSGFRALPDKAKASILIIHGVGEYSYSYRDVADMACNNGYAVYAADLPGHGRSGGKRGHAGSTGELMDCVDAVIEKAKKENPGLPVVVMGNSMGGNIALSHRYYRRMSGVRAYVAVSPWLEIGNQAFRFHNLAKLAACFAPRKTVQAFPFNDKVLSDPLVHNLISLRTAVDRERDAKAVIENAELGPPVYLCTGSEDKVCLPSGAKEFRDSAGRLCTYREIEGLGHNVIHSSQWRQVMDGVIEWMDWETRRR